MFWRLGWFLNSLKYHAEKDIRDTIYKNQDFRKNRWNPLERLIIWGSKHFVIANILLMIIATALFCFISANYTFLKTLLPSSIGGLNPIIQFQSNIFEAQVTIIGLIFPLVIAFIGVLLQGKSSNESMWIVYRQNSGFMLVGFSALTLIISFTTIKLYQPWLTHQSIVAASISITAWFLVNLSLSMWFIWKTIEFISPNSRMTMIVKYTINEVAPNDIRKRLLAYHFSSACETGLLFKSRDNNLDVVTFSLEELPRELLLKSSKNQIITNVWYLPLNLGIWLWTKQVRCKKATAEKIVLNLPFNINSYRPKKTVLATTNGNKINCFSELLIRLAVRTSSKKQQTALSMNQMTGALFGQIEDSLKESNSRLFDSAKANLVKFHKEIESSMLFINDQRKPDNWLLLTASAFPGHNLINEFIRESINITQKTIHRIPNDASYYESWCNLYIQLFSIHESKTSARIITAYFDGHYCIWSRLIRWMELPQTKLSIFDEHDRAIKYFIGSWEDWRYRFNPQEEKYYFYVRRHLINTSKMLICAFKYRNIAATRWASDILTHWGEFFCRDNPIYNYSYELISPEILVPPTKDIIEDAVFGEYKLSNIEAMTIALNNHWIDIRCITAAYLFLGQSHVTDSRYREIISALLACEHIETAEGTTINQQASLTTASDIIVVYLRQNIQWHKEHSYNSSLSEYFSELAKIEEPEYILGRIYSYPSSDKHTKIKTFFKIFGIGLTKSNFSINQKLLGFLKSDALKQSQLINIISELTALTVINDKDIEQVSNQFGFDDTMSRSRAQQFSASINNIITDLNAELSSQILGAPIDEERLLQLGRAASIRTFTVPDGPMPISFFDEIEYVDDFQSDLVITNVPKYDKSNVSKGINVDRASNEEEFLNSIISRRATTVSFHQLLKQCHWKETKFIDAISVISQAVTDSLSIESEKLSPVLFIGPWDVYHLIESSKWQYNESEILPFKITTESGKNDNYVCHLAGIEVYKFPFDKFNYSILLPMETFQSINIKRFDENRYVDADFKTVSENDLTGTLSLSFGIECEFKPVKCFKYISLNPDD